MLVISCHADTGFHSHSVRKISNGLVEGILDNFAGVYSVMKAYFSGRLNNDHVRIELTHGEEEDFAGACKVLKTLRKRDVVIVVDVTGTPTSKDFVIEKCRDKNLRDFLVDILSGLSFDIYEDCPDPIGDEDEVDVYSKKCRYVCAFAVPCSGGDYNEGPVICKEESLDAIAEAISMLVERFPEFCERYRIKIGKKTKAAV